MRTRAAVAFGAAEPLRIVELELDELRDDEVRVRLVASGVCHTDAVVRDQVIPTPLPAVLGHEGAGVVEAVGSGVRDVVVGDHVVLSFAHCGDCRNCRAGHPGYCAHLAAENFGGARRDGSTSLTTVDGEPVSSHFFGQSSFAEYANVARRSVVVVPRDVPLEILGPLGCGVQTGAGAMLTVLDPGPGSTVAVFGAGAVGMSGILAARVADADTIIAVDVVESRLRLALQLGATHALDARAVDVVEAIRQITGGGVDRALDTTGNPRVFAQMTRSLGSRGHGALVGTAPPGTEAAVEIGDLLQAGVTLSTVIQGDVVPADFIPRLIGLHRAGRFPFDALVRRYPFDDIDQAFADSESGITLKPVVVF